MISINTKALLLSRYMVRKVNAVCMSCTRMNSEWTTKIRTKLHRMQQDCVKQHSENLRQIDNTCLAKKIQADAEADIKKDLCAKQYEADLEAYRDRLRVL